MKIRGRKRIFGELKVPGDKSISHRAVIIGSISQGNTIIDNCLLSNDTLNTIEIFRQMGTSIEVDYKEERVSIIGNKLKKPVQSLDCGNSGTTMRLLSGILCGQNFSSTLTGDESLQNRPMDRIIKPLSLMGSNIRAEEGKAPIYIEPSDKLTNINYELPIASAQVKSSILFASLYTKGNTKIQENKITRDHTERMLSYYGANLSKDKNIITIDNPSKLEGKTILVPGDISSASYFIVAASIIEGSSVIIKDVGINPTRIGIINVLKQMGGDITIENGREFNNEPIGDIIVHYKPLKGITIDGDIIGTLIDEIPIITVAAIFAQGDTIIRDAKELRYKESDRIETISNELIKMGGDIETLADGLLIHGSSKLKPAIVDSYNDHRIAMSLAIAALNTEGTTEVLNFDCVENSYPDFIKDLGKIVDYTFELS